MEYRERTNPLKGKDGCFYYSLEALQQANRSFNERTNVKENRSKTLEQQVQ